MALSSKLPFTEPCIKYNDGHLYAVGHTNKNFGSRQNGIQNQDRALISLLCDIGPFFESL